ncbi:hypothetical protein NC651_036318 [Populus alba x Populus x berolinensis]|nr:hypothetical protein NC651_036318 [Populus alba x Populus x berolinensis]
MAFFWFGWCCCCCLICSSQSYFSSAAVSLCLMPLLASSMLEWCATSLLVLCLC